MMYTLEGAGELGRRAASIVEEKLSEGFRNRKTEGFLETRLVHLDLPVRKVTPAEYETAKAGLHSEIILRQPISVSYSAPSTSIFI